MSDYLPWFSYIAELLLRRQERLRLFGMHPSDICILEENALQWFRLKSIPSPERGKRAIVSHKDGFSALKVLLPPPSRRMVVLLDPSYEIKQDYQQVITALSDALIQLPTGTYLIWYPILQRIEFRRFPRQLKKVSNRKWLHLTFHVAFPVPDGTGFVVSGMFIVNPPLETRGSV